MICSFLDQSSRHLSPETWASLDVWTTDEKVHGLRQSAQLVPVRGIRYGPFGR